MAQLPDTPTIAEQGLIGFEAANWYGVIAPAGTPAAVVAKLHEAASGALREGQARDALTNLGATIIGDGPEAFSAYIAAESLKWAAVVKASGAHLD